MNKVKFDGLNANQQKALLDASAHEVSIIVSEISSIWYIFGICISGRDAYLY